MIYKNLFIHGNDATDLSRLASPLLLLFWNDFSIYLSPRLGCPGTYAEAQPPALSVGLSTKPTLPSPTY